MRPTVGRMSELTIRALSPETWDAYAALIERHNGVWGGCWCTYFHRAQSGQDPSEIEREYGPQGSRVFKEQLVKAGQARAALVFDGDRCVGWAQFGPPSEISVQHRKQVEVDGYRWPDYRITCFFIDRDYRRQGVAERALQGALELIAAAGGGRVESYPQDTGGKKTSASYLYNATASLFERNGFELERTKGKNHTVMSRTVAPS